MRNLTHIESDQVNGGILPLIPIIVGIDIAILIVATVAAARIEDNNNSTPPSDSTGG